MGRCHEFGLQIRDGCGHAMVAGKSSCSCAECRVVCGGRFAGCPDVWARGPQPVTLAINNDEQPAPPLKRTTNGAAVTPTARPKVVSTRVEGAAVKAASAGPVSASVSAAAPAAEAKAPAAEAAAAAKPPGPAAKKPAPKVPEAPTVKATVPDDPPVSQPVTVPEPPVPVAPPPARSPTSQAPASAAALRWLEGAFAGLRAELQSLRGHLNQQQATMAELVGGITQQQALLSELLEAREVDFRLAEAAEALPQFVSDAVAHEVRVNRERTVAAVASTLDTRLAEANIGENPPLQQLERNVAELRAFLENDPATGSIVAAISTEAATRAMRAEVAEQLPKALNQALAGSDARMDEMAERMDKLLTRAMRVGAQAATADKTGRASATSAAKPGPSAARATATAPRKPAATKKAGAPKATKRVTSSTRTVAERPAKASATKASATKASATKASAKTAPVKKAAVTRTRAVSVAKAKSATTGKRAAANRATGRPRRASPKTKAPQA